VQVPNRNKILGDLLEILAPILAIIRTSMGNNPSELFDNAYKFSTRDNRYPANKLIITLATSLAASDERLYRCRATVEQYRNMPLDANKLYYAAIYRQRMKGGNVPGVVDDGRIKPGAGNNAVIELEEDLKRQGKRMFDEWVIYDDEDWPNRLQMWTVAYGYVRQLAIAEYLQEEAEERGTFDADALQPSALLEKGHGELLSEARHWAIDVCSAKDELPHEWDDFVKYAKELGDATRQAIEQAFAIARAAGNTEEAILPFYSQCL